MLDRLDTATILQARIHAHTYALYRTLQNSLYRNSDCNLFSNRKFGASFLRRNNRIDGQEATEPKVFWYEFVVNDCSFFFVDRLFQRSVLSVHFEYHFKKKKKIIVHGQWLEITRRSCCTQKDTHTHTGRQAGRRTGGQIHRHTCTLNNKPLREKENGMRVKDRQR